MSGFRDSLQFKIPAVFALAFVLVLAAIFGVLSTVGKALLEKQAYEQVGLTGHNIVSELGRQVALAESLATALANLGERLRRSRICTKPTRYWNSGSPSAPNNCARKSINASRTRPSRMLTRRASRSSTRPSYGCPCTRRCHRAISRQPPASSPR